MVYRHLARGLPVPADIAKLIMIDAMVERGYSLSDLLALGFSLPIREDLPYLVLRVAAGRTRYIQAMMEKEVKR